MKQRWDIINWLIKERAYKNYLEVGTASGKCFTKIECEKKTCVDPQKKFEDLTYEMTSDEFFKNNQEEFDIIFVDGLHEHSQVKKDIANSLMFLKQGGCLVIHDTNPPTYENVVQHLKWNGDVYKAVVDMRALSSISIFTLDTDWGCAVVFKGQMPEYQSYACKPEDREWENFDVKRKTLLNITEERDFKEIFAPKKKGFLSKIIG
ncbi:MAG: class I SAM-dependent methyltransferase [Bacteroidota bacterium]